MTLLESLNPFRYKLSELAPMLTSLVFLIGYGATLFITAPIGFIPAVAALIGPVFAVIAVFTAKAASPEDLSKALEQLKGAALAVAVYFTTVPATTVNKIGIAIGAFVSFVAVIWAHQRMAKTNPALVGVKTPATLEGKTQVGKK